MGILGIFAVGVACSAVAGLAGAILGLLRLAAGRLALDFAERAGQSRDR